MKRLAVTLLIIPKLLLTGPAITGKVTEVPDVHTLRLGAISVRLWGVETPFGSLQCTYPDGSIDPCGVTALNSLTVLVVNQKVRCELKGFIRDQILARCTVDGHDIAEIQVSAGLLAASPYHGQKAYVDEQRWARLARVGIWGGAVSTP